MGEWLRGVLQRQAARRTPERRNLLNPGRGQDRDRAIAQILQNRPTALIVGIQAAGTRGHLLAGLARLVAGRSAGHSAAGRTATAQLTFNADLSVEAGHEKLALSLSDPEIRDEAATLLRELIDTIRVASTEHGWMVEIKGEVGRMVNLAEGKTEQNQCSVKVVAGARNPRQFVLPSIEI